MRRSIRLAAIAGVAVATLLLASPASAQEEPDGAEVYENACAACHQSSGEGVAGSFPPLVDNPNVADSDYVRIVILEGKTGPIDVNGVVYDAEMPAIDLTDAEVAAVTAYIQGNVFTPSDVAPVGEGAAATGSRLFVGRIGLENGGPACHACHSAGDHHDMGGPTLGPDLTDLIERFGTTEAVAAALANPPSAVMEPVFADKPLSDQERADLAAYLGSLTTESDPPADYLLYFGAMGGVVMLGAMYLFSKRNKINYLQQLRSRA